MDEIYQLLLLAGTSKISLPLTKRMAYDSNNRLQFYGVAPGGSATSSAVWTVWKYTYDSNGLVSYIQVSNSSFPTAQGIKWDDILTASYFT